MKKLAVILGPNLNMTGIREKTLYGCEKFSDINECILEHAKKYNFDCEIFQSNHEGDLIDKIHSLVGKIDGIIINAGGLTHYSICLRDALACIDAPCIEVHVTNIYAREKFRSTSVISDVCIGAIVGLGNHGYMLAIDALSRIL